MVDRRIDAGAPPERKLTDEEYLTRALNERRQAAINVAGNLSRLIRATNDKDVEEMSQALANSLDVYIARSSQGWVR